MAKPTDWNSYYQRPIPSSTYSRYITNRLIVKLIKQFCTPHPRIIELGGANSCFFDTIKKELLPYSYTIIDNNQTGLSLTEFDTKLINLNVLDIKNNDMRSDLVFSVGLIEHFNKKDTSRAISSHFKLLKSGGICILTFPTPTLLYRISRKIAETLKMWIFFDERPLTFDEVEQSLKKHGTIIYKTINWPIIFTQGIIVVRKE